MTVEFDASRVPPASAGVVPASVLAECRGEPLAPEDVDEGVLLVPWSVRRQLCDRLAEHQVTVESARRLTAHVPCEHDGREFSCAIVFTVTLSDVAPLVAAELCACDAQGRDPFVTRGDGPHLATEVLDAARARMVDGEFASDLPPVGSLASIVATLLLDATPEVSSGRHVQLGDALILLAGAAAVLPDVVATARALDGAPERLGEVEAPPAWRTPVRRPMLPSIRAPRGV